MIDEETKRAWRLFRAAFKDGEHVVVETSDGKFHTGKLLAGDFELSLRRQGRPAVVLNWDNVEFVAHDGFPVKHLKGVSPEIAADWGQRTPNRIIRRLLNNVQARITPSPKTDYDARHRQACRECVYTRTTIFGGGCPFIAGPARLIEIHNRGRTGPQWCYTDECEVLVFKSSDGAVMHSYDTDHLFLPERVGV